MKNLTLAALLFLGFTTTALSESEIPEMTVYKSATCGCCNAWIDYMRDNGFNVVAHNAENMDAVKARLGLTDGRLKSCHTAVIGDYLVEGHVPAADVKRLLAERPKLKGLSAPGMPQMSPGMASIVPKDYDVIGFNDSGDLFLFSRY